MTWRTGTNYCLKFSILALIIAFGSGTIAFAGSSPGTLPQKTAPARLPAFSTFSGGPMVLRNNTNTDAIVPLNPVGVGIINGSGNGYSGMDLNQGGGFVPPDTCGAAGPSNYVETVNQEIAIYSPKSTGATALLDSLDHFFFTAGGLSRASLTSFLSDPIVVYDELIGRFIIGDQDVDFGTLHVSNFVIAVSKTSNPATLTAADWNFYSLSTTEVGFDADYPGNFGYNADAFVFTLNMFPVAAGSNHVLVTSVNAADLAAGVSQASLHSFKSDLSDFSVRPTTMHGAMAGDPMWLVTEHGDGLNIDVIKMTNLLSNSPVFTTTSLPVNSYSTVVPPLNPDGSVITNNIDSRILKAAELNNKLVATHAVSVSSTQDVARWYVIDVSSGTPTLADQGQVSAGNNTYLTYPAIDISGSCGAIGMTYIRSGTDTATDYMSMYVTARAPGDPAGTMETPVLVPAGAGKANDSGDSRAGDLSGINVDPADGSFWAANEFANTGGNWGTAIANFGIPSTSSTFTISASASPIAGGSVSGAGVYNCGSTVNLVATANSCYNFVNWTEGATVVSTSAAYSFAASSNRTLVANFVPSDTIPPVITVPKTIDLIAQTKKVGGRFGAFATFSVSAFDPGNGPVLATASPPSGSFFPVGTTIVTVTATDACGNTATQNFAVTVAIRRKRHAPF